MLRVALFNLVASVLVTALHVQVPMESSRHWQDEYPAILDDDYSKWSIDELPNPNSTDHLIFETVHSLLQHWPNTRMRHGHNIVPGIIPKGTLLYHGTNHKELPSGPEWVATDPEYSRFFCWNVWSIIQLEEDTCWFHTLTTTRPLKIIHFDGSSGAKFPDGSLDSQDLLIWGESRPEDAFEELARIKYICEWVQEFGMDGIVRMGANFEVMLCDFTSGVREISSVNLEPPAGFPEILSGLTTFEAINAGTWHNRFPGETRVQLDLARLVSFYDTELVPSLVAIRAGQERWDHRLRNITKEDLSAVKSKVEAVMIRPWGSSSEIDWKTLVQVIVDRFSQRLELIRHLLNSPATNPDEILNVANKTQTQLRIMLTPYILLSATPTDSSDNTDLDWTKPIYGLCATAHTSFIESELDTMTDSEKLLLQAIRGTNREICRVVTKMWAAGVYVGIDSSLNTKELFEVAEVAQVRGKWIEDLNRLMGWLDWSMWVKCNPECGLEEMCYLPTWPIAFPGFPPPPKDRHSFNTINIPEVTDEWIRPQPKCISRFDPKY